MTKYNYELIVAQREDLMSVYRRVAPHCHSQKEAWEKVVSSAAPRYYVTARQAWDRLRHMVVGDFSEVDAMRPLKREMYYSLFQKYIELSQKKQYAGKSLWFVCQFLVLEAAPQFFMRPMNLKFIFSFYKKYGKDYKEMEIRRQKKLAAKDND